MSENPTKLFLDAQHLIYLAKSGGIHCGQDEVKATAAGKTALSSHLFSNFDVVITDAVFLETTRKASAPDARLIAEWVSENGIEPLKTATGARLLTEKVKNGGEISIVEAIRNLPVDQPYFIAVDDTRGKKIWSDHDVPEALKVGTVAVLNMMYDNGNGTLPGDQYAAIANGLMQFVPQVPNLDLLGSLSPRSTLAPRAAALSPKTARST